MCAAQECTCLTSNYVLPKSSQPFNMPWIHTVNCTADALPCECQHSMPKLFISAQNCGSVKNTASTVENNSKAQSKKSLYISKVGKYSFIASDYISPQGQKLLSIKVCQNQPEVDVIKSKNFSSKRSISEYFLSKNESEKNICDDKSKKSSLFKSWQNSIFKYLVISHEEQSNSDFKTIKYHNSFVEVNEDIPPSHFNAALFCHQSFSEYEAGGSGINTKSLPVDDKLSQKGTVFDIESLSELGDSVSIENNTHFGFDDAWFIPSVRHTFNAADISGSASAAQLSLASSFGDNSLPICKICHTAAKPEDPLISPCRCTGTLRYIHCGCLMKWLEICNKRSRKPATCELCKYQFHWHKKFKVGQWQFPKCSWQDKILHTLCLLSALVMIGCAVVSVLCFKQHKGERSEITPLELTHSEVITLICGALFFLSFFLLMYVEIKAKNTIIKLIRKFFYLNQQWYIDEYDKLKENSAIDV